MRGLTALGILGLLACYPLQASAGGSPDLAVHFFNAIPDVCFQTARGKQPTPENAEGHLIEVASDIPPSVRAHFGRVPTWFRLKTEPDEVFIGVGDSPGACHVVLANTTQTVQVHRKVAGLLQAGGFQVIHENTVPGSDIDMIFVKKAPDGYMLISLQAPQDVVHGGMGYQGVVHVNLMPAAMFEAMLQKR